MDLSIMWIIVLILFILVEMFTAGLISIWFVFGSLIALFVSFFTDNFIIQILIFSVVSLITLILFKPLISKYMIKKMEKTNLDTVIGKIAIVTKVPTKTINGQAKVQGKFWTIISEDEIELDEDVEVLSIEGVKLKVRKVEK